MLCMVEILVSKENDLPFQESVPYRLQLLRRQWPAEINAADLRTDMQCQGNDFDRLRRIGTVRRLTLRDHLQFLLDRRFGWTVIPRVEAVNFRTDAMSLLPFAETAISS
jgi:hypothetical protein